MHANNDHAVSPVIAVILMVAITVVLAASVYYWVTSMSSDTHAPPGSLALSSAGLETTDNERSFTVRAASQNLAWDDIELHLGNLTLTHVESTPDDDEWSSPSGIVHAGDTLTLNARSSTEGALMLLTQTSSNSVLISWTL